MQAYYSAGDSVNRCPPYTAAEKQWIKDRWGSEYYFLQYLHLSIGRDEDRDEGRLIARDMIRQASRRQVVVC